MNWRNSILAALAICASANSGTAQAQAPARVGEAAVVKNEVIRVTGSGGTPINVGDAVLRNETVRTGADSATRLVMIDSTNLSLGANSSITLDKTVFNDEQSYRDVTIRLTTGAFRFVTGHSDKNAYKITTPLATIGVRGTTLDILSQRGRSVVVAAGRRGAGLHQHLPVRRPHSARRYRRHYLVQRQDLDHRRPTCRPGPLLRTARPPRACAAPRNMPALRR